MKNVVLAVIFSIVLATIKRVSSFETAVLSGLVTIIFILNSKE